MAKSAQTPARSAGGISGKRLRKTGVEREEGPASRAGIDRVRVVRLKKRVGGSADGRVGVGRRPNALKRKRRLQPLPCVARHERQRLEPSLTRLAGQKCCCCWTKWRTIRGEGLRRGAGARPLNNTEEIRVRGHSSRSSQSFPLIVLVLELVLVLDFFFI